MVVSDAGVEKQQQSIRVEHDYMGLNGKHASSSSSSSSSLNQSSINVAGQGAAGVKTELSLGLGLSQASSSSSSSSSPLAEVVEESGKECASADTFSWFSRLISQQQQQQQQQQKNPAVQSNGSSSVFLSSKLGPSVTPSWAESTSSVYRLAANPTPSNLPTKRVYVETIASEPKAVTHVTTPSGVSTGAQPPAWPFAWKTPENSGSTPVVGWPPVRSFRKNTLLTNNALISQPKNEPPPNNSQTKPSSDPPPPNPDQNLNLNPNPKPPQNTLFVKANMDGVPIGRKIDLKSFNSYESLKLALEDMFQPFTKENLLVTNPEEKQHVKFLHGQDYVLTHEDKDGDWMFVGDVPWQMFITTVKRLRVMRSSEASGLGWKPRAES